MKDTSYTLHPKDKGWAWVIMMGSFSVNTVLVGYLRSFGLLFVAIQNQYGYSSGLISVVVGVQNVCFCLVTVLVMNVFIKKNSVRSSCIIGILLQTLAVSVCNLVQNSVFLIVCLGLIFGIGQGFLHFPSQYMVPIYFQKRQSMAVIFASSGASIGGIIFPIITKTLLDFYGLQGSLLMISGILLNQLIFVIIYTPPSEYGISEQNIISVDSGNEEVELHHGLLNSDADAHDVDFELQVRPQNDSEEGFSQQNNKISVDIGNDSEANDVDAQPEVSSQNNTLAPEPASETERNETKKQHDCNESNFCSNCCFHSKTSYLENDHRGIGERGNKVEANRQSDKLQRSFSHLKSLPTKSTKCRLSIPDVFYSRMFWVLLVYFIGCSVGSGCTSLFIPPLAIEKGLNDDASAYFLTLSAVMDIVGRFICGFVLQLGLTTPSRSAIVPQVIGCVMFSLTYVIQDYTGVLILSIVYGLISSSFFATRALLIIEVLGMSHLASASGYYGLVTGLAMGISFPIGGFLHDATGTYSASFVYLAACFLLGILSLVAVQILKPKKIKENRSKSI